MLSRHIVLRSTFLALLSIWLALPAPSPAQIVAPDMRLDETLTSATQTAVLSRPNGTALCTICEVHLIVTGTPTGCVGQLEGSETNAAGSWVNLGGTADTVEGDCTATIGFSVASRPARYMRFNLTTLSGGTDPAVRVLIRGIK